MNTQYSVLKVSIILVALLCNEVSFGMLGMQCYPGKNKIMALGAHSNSSCVPYSDENELEKTFKLDDNTILYNQPHTIIPLEVIEDIAAGAHDTTKDNFRKTCKYLYMAVSSHNVKFVANPFFTAGSHKLIYMAFHSDWYNNQAMIHALPKNVNGHCFIDYTQCDSSGTMISKSGGRFKPGFLGMLNKKYNTSNHDFSLVLKSEVDLAIHCAVLCDDTQAIKNIAPKIKVLYRQAHGYGKSAVYEDLMKVLVNRDNKEAFEFMVKEDPYQIRLYHSIGQHYYEETLLDILNNTADKNVDFYKKICEQYGEKTSAQATPAFCIIS